MQFLRRPRPADNELLSSFLLRLTQANGYTNYQAILDYVDIQSDLHKFNYLSKPTTSLEMLSRATDVEESRLWEMVFPAIDGRSVRAYNSTLQYEWLEREKIKICPACFAEEGYCHKHWSLWCYTSCHIHQCLLADTCPQCQSVWYWDDLKDDWKCKCGWNFRDTPIAKLEQGDNDLSRLVAHSCGLSEGESVALKIGSPLSALSLSQISLLMMSTALSLHNSGGSLHQLKLPSSNLELHGLLERCAIVYKSESSNLAYFLQWVDRVYRVEYKRAGQRKNHLQRLSLISTFRNKLEDLRLVPR